MKPPSQGLSSPGAVLRAAPSNSAPASVQPLLLAFHQEHERRPTHPPFRHRHGNHLASKLWWSTGEGWLEGGRKAARMEEPDGWPECLLSLLRTLYGGGSHPASAVPHLPSPPPSPLLAGSSASSLTPAWLSQQLDHGDIGEDDVALRHGLLQFHGLAAQGPAEMLLPRLGGPAGHQPSAMTSQSSDVTEAVAQRAHPGGDVLSAHCAPPFQCLGMCPDRE